MNHPCQSLADWKTLDDLKVPANGGKFVLSWAYHPRALPLAVPAATVHMAAMRGMDVTVLRPDGFALPAPDHGQGQGRGRTVRGLGLGNRSARRGAAGRTHYLREVLVIDTALWRPHGDTELRPNSITGAWNEDWFETAQSDCRFMHCLPVRRGVVVSEEVLDGPRSVVLHEAYNRMLAQMAVLHQMLAAT